MEGNQERFQEKKGFNLSSNFAKKFSNNSNNNTWKISRNDDYGEISTKQATNVTS